MGKQLPPLEELLKPSVLVTEDHVGSLEYGCSILCTTTIKISIYELGIPCSKLRKNREKGFGPEAI